MTIEERLEFLEKELKRTKHHNRYLLGVLILFLGVGLIGASPSQKVKEIKTSQLDLVDENGKARAILGINHGLPGLILWDENNKPRIMLSIDKTGPKFAFFDESGTPRETMGLVNGVPGLALTDSTGKITWETP